MREDTRIGGLLWVALKGILSAKIEPSTRVMTPASTPRFRVKLCASSEKSGRVDVSECASADQKIESSIDLLASVCL